MEQFYLSNGIEVLYNQTTNTPRTALFVYFDIDEPEKIPGEYVLLNRLLMQGTKTRSSEDIAIELDENAIECSIEMKQDYIRFKTLFLNEDINKGIDICSDMMMNSTFEEFEKERNKLRAQIVADLDSPKMQAFDNFGKTLFENHYYGHTYTRILESLDSIKIECIKESYEKIKQTRKVISVASALDKEDIIPFLEKYFSKLTINKEDSISIEVPSLEGSKIVKIAKEDVAQAQIIQGWIVPSILDEDYFALQIFNMILGGAGLSSRLFVELRDKQGLAYNVRSIYDNFRKAAGFSIYIATAPKNIEIALNGFIHEINRIKNDGVSSKELEDSMENLMGRREFYYETNLNLASLYGYNAIMGLSSNFETEYKQKIKNVTVSDVVRVANKYFNDNNVISVLAPEKYLEVLK